MNLSFDNKIKIWLHYVASVSLLNNDLLEINIHEYTEKHFGKEYKDLIKYPILLPNKIFINSGFNIKPRSFENFCNEKDSRISEGLQGYYWRFKNEINL